MVFIRPSTPAKLRETAIHGFRTTDDLPWIVEQVKSRQFRPKEIYAFLTNSDRFDVKNKVVKKIQNGGFQLYGSEGYKQCRDDGYCWDQKRNNKGVRETRRRLKLDNAAIVISIQSVSGVDMPTFFRRIYSIEGDLKQIVLVHYLDKATANIDLEFILGKISEPYMSNEGQRDVIVPTMTRALSENSYTDVPLDAIHMMADLKAGSGQHGVKMEDGIPSHMIALVHEVGELDEKNVEVTSDLRFAGEELHKNANNVEQAKLIIDKCQKRLGELAMESADDKLFALVGRLHKAQKLLNGSMKKLM